MSYFKPVVPGGAGGATPDFDILVNPISTKKGQIMPTMLLLAPPDFQTFLPPWITITTNSQANPVASALNFCVLRKYLVQNFCFKSG